jgi:hypothetical protein
VYPFGNPPKNKIAMKEKTFFMVNRPLADMHMDGVRFDPKIKEALKNQRADQEINGENS